MTAPRPAAGAGGGSATGVPLTPSPLPPHKEEPAGGGGGDDEQPPAQDAGCCLPCKAVFSKEARATHQRRWRGRLHAALRGGDAAELAAWVKHYRGLLGPRGTGEMEAALWAAVERRAAPLVKVLVVAPPAGGGGGGGGANASMTAAAALPNLPAQEWQLQPAHPQQSSRTYRTRSSRRAVADAVAGFVAAAAASFGSSTRNGSSARAAAAAAATAGAELTATAEAAAADAATAAGSSDSLTVLMLAVKVGAPEVVAHLLAAGGADVGATQPDFDDWAAAHHAVLLSSTSASTASSGGAASGGSASLQCLDLVLKALGPDRLRAARVAAAARADTLPRFAVRCGRAAAVRALLAVGGEAEGQDGGGGGLLAACGDDGSCAWLAGQLGVTVEVWDVPVPPPTLPRTRRQQQLQPNQQPATADGGDDGWVRSPPEALVTRRRRQLLCGAAAGGRLAVVERVLCKPPPYDTLLRDELDAVLAACERAPADPDGASAAAAPTGASAAAVAAAAAAAAPLGGLVGREEMRSRLQALVHPYLDLEGEVLPALRALDVEAAAGWLAADLPPPSAVDAALAAAMSAEVLLLTAPERASKLVELLLHYGADIHTSWRAGGGGDEEETEAVILLRPLTAAVRVGSAPLVQQLLAAGADPLLRDGGGAHNENALMLAVRAAATRGLPALACRAPVLARSAALLQLQADAVAGRGLQTAAGAEAGEAQEQDPDWAACLGHLLGHRSVTPEVLNQQTNAGGLTVAQLAIMLDQPRCLELLVAAKANPWAQPAAPPPAAPATPKQLLGRWAPQLLPAAGKWSVVHEAARHGSLGALQVLLGLCEQAAPVPPGVREWELPAPSAASPAPDSAAQGAACARRDALVGAIRGGREGAARLALEPDRNGLYEEELEAAEALLAEHFAAAAAAAAGKTAAAKRDGVNRLHRAGPGAAPDSDPASFEALRQYLRSRKHTYLDWGRDVVPRLRAYDAAGVSQWLHDDRVAPEQATAALTLVVREAAAALLGSGGGDIGARANPGTSSGSGAGHHSGSGSDCASYGLHIDDPITAAGTVGGGGGADANKLLVAVVEALLGAGANINHTDGSEGLPMLTLATRNGHSALVSHLLARGARPDATDAAGYNALDHAVAHMRAHGHSRCLEALLAMPPAPGFATAAALLNAHRAPAAAGGCTTLGLAVWEGCVEATRLLLAAGADPLLSDTRRGDNALMTAVRAAAAQGLPTPSQQGIAPVLQPIQLPEPALAQLPQREQQQQLMMSSQHDFADAASSEELEEPTPAARLAPLDWHNWEGCLGALLQSPVITVGQLNGRTNADGLTAALLAVVLDQPRCLELLVAAKANPWAQPAAPPPAAPATPKQLLGRWAPQLLPAAGKWSVVHEAARHGSLGALQVLLGLCEQAAPAPPGVREWELPAPSAASPAPDSAAQGVACARRDALVGAIRGGREGAARLALEPDRNGLYEEELEAAEALLDASASSAVVGSTLPDSGSAGVAAATADPPSYEALRQYLRSRKHSYLDWGRDVVLRLRAYDAAGVSQWLHDDRATPEQATAALTLVVREGVPVAAGSGSMSSSISSPSGSPSSFPVTSSSGVAAGDGALLLCQVVDVLAQRGGADTNNTDGQEAFPLLTLAARNGHSALVSHLLARGARPDATDAAGYNALDHAVAHMRAHGHSRCLEALLAMPPAPGFATAAALLNAHRAPAAAGGCTTLGLAVWEGCVEATRLLLAAGADPLLSDTRRGDNALMTAVRAAAAQGLPTLSQQGMAPVLQLLQPPLLQTATAQQQRLQPTATAAGFQGAVQYGSTGIAERPDWEGCLNALLLSPAVAATPAGGVLNGRTNAGGLTVALLAVVLDQPRCLELLVAAKANPWAQPAAPPPAALATPKQLLGRWAPQLLPAAGKWSVVHEAARHGSLGALQVLLGLCEQAAPAPPGVREWELPAPSAASPAPDSAAQGVACARRDALVGAIRGGREGAARLALEPDRNGLYEEELEAAEALLDASASSAVVGSTLPDSGAAGVAAATADPPSYEALRQYLRSRKHSYLDWGRDVVPRLRAYDAAGVSQWLHDDRVAPARATAVLSLVVEAAAPTSEQQRLCATVDALLVVGGAAVNSAHGPARLALLMMATRSGHAALVSHLLARGARPDATDAAGYNALDHAVAHMRAHGHSRCLEALLQFASRATSSSTSNGGGGGAGLLHALLVTHRTHAGDTSLCLAVRVGDTAAVRLLLGAGADPLQQTSSDSTNNVGTAASGKGKSAVYLAGYLGNEEALAALRLPPVRQPGGGQAAAQREAAAAREAVMGAVAGGQLALLEGQLLKLPPALEALCRLPAGARPQQQQQTQQLAAAAEAGASRAELARTELAKLREPLAAAADMCRKLQPQQQDQQREAKSSDRNGGASGSSSAAAGAAAATAAAAAERYRVARLTEQYLQAKAAVLQKLQAAHAGAAGSYRAAGAKLQALAAAGRDRQAAMRGAAAARDRQLAAAAAAQSGRVSTCSQAQQDRIKASAAKQLQAAKAAAAKKLAEAEGRRGGPREREQQINGLRSAVRDKVSAARARLEAGVDAAVAKIHSAEASLSVQQAKLARYPASAPGRNAAVAAVNEKQVAINAAVAALQQQAAAQRGALDTAAAQREAQAAAALRAVAAYRERARSAAAKAQAAAETRIQGWSSDSQQRAAAETRKQLGLIQSRVASAQEDTAQKLAAGLAQLEQWQGEQGQLTWEAADGYAAAAEEVVEAMVEGAGQAFIRQALAARQAQMRRGAPGGRVRNVNPWKLLVARDRKAAEREWRRRREEEMQLLQQQAIAGAAALQQLSADPQQDDGGGGGAGEGDATDSSGAWVSDLLQGRDAWEQEALWQDLGMEEAAAALAAEGRADGAAGTAAGDTGAADGGAGGDGGGGGCGGGQEDPWAAAGGGGGGVCGGWGPVFGDPVVLVDEGPGQQWQEPGGCGGLLEAAADDGGGGVDQLLAGLQLPPELAAGAGEGNGALASGLVDGFDAAASFDMGGDAGGGLLGLSPLDLPSPGDLPDLDLGSLPDIDIGSSMPDINVDAGMGSLDLGSLDLGNLDLGSLDLNLGSVDIGSLTVSDLAVPDVQIEIQDFSIPAMDNFVIPEYVAPPVEVPVMVMSQPVVDYGGGGGGWNDGGGGGGGDMFGF
ncbi:hypothetical protein HXX76_014810 [Chlamydomonas incerta]|uniref:Uncharacterized protein n=1 Tax=Chlamydomonas incerta TaxID=51695 RepID=A0A835VSU8_CHLIN|nr:hypothetical protein HXX76_014810 [Chlamydomonas incerta]|eukprot:KAG2424136.1 hypothetical protein HXX76_014810 [Chlamydomonas incerta]